MVVPWSCASLEGAVLPVCTIDSSRQHSATHWGAAFSISKSAEQIYKPTMNDATKRTIARWIHLVFGIPIIGYVYSPFAELPNYAPVVRFISIPVLVLTGFWMWKGHLLRRLFSKRSA
jgi:hypothetical protein